MTVSLISSFRTEAVFRLGFAVLGSLWLSSTLGFALETPVDGPAYDLESGLERVESWARITPPIEDYSTLRKSTMHDLFHSIGRVRKPNFQEIPDMGNTMRLAACWSAILID